MTWFTHLKVEIIENASKEAGGFNEIILVLNGSERANANILKSEKGH